MLFLLLLIPVLLVSIALYAVLKPASWKLHVLYTLGYVIITSVVSLLSAAVSGWRDGAFESADVIYTFTTITFCMMVGLGGYSLFRPYL